MANYLIRRLLQMVLVIFLSAVASYALLNLVPGGPMAGLRQQTQSSRFRITEEDIKRIRAYFELDLYIPVRFTRWFAGWPTGPVTIFGQDVFSTLPIGCTTEIQATVQDARGNISIKTIGCKESVYLTDLVGRRTSKGIIRGDFGNSWRLNRDRPVIDLLVTRIPETLSLMGISTVLSLLIGIPLGVYSAVKQYSRFDYIFTTLAFMGSSMPTFFFGILAVLTLSVIPFKNGWFYFPPGSSAAVRDYTVPLLGTIQPKSFLDVVMHLALPVTVLTIVSVSGWSRYVRSSMLEVLRQDYVRTARAKGLTERLVILKHALRNGMIPFVTLVVFTLPSLISGAIITETIFSWPGMGRLYFLALGDSDYPVAMAIIFIIAVLTIFATLLRDILYTLVDPRIRLS